LETHFCSSPASQLVNDLQTRQKTAIDMSPSTLSKLTAYGGRGSDALVRPDFWVRSSSHETLYLDLLEGKLPVLPSVAGALCHFAIFDAAVERKCLFRLSRRVPNQQSPFRLLSRVFQRSIGADVRKLAAWCLLASSLGISSRRRRLNVEGKTGGRPNRAGQPAGTHRHPSKL
jgi:hypothetical protein